MAGECPAWQRRVGVSQVQGDNWLRYV